jgi:hypothetical protein
LAPEAFAGYDKTISELIPAGAGSLFPIHRSTGPPAAERGRPVNRGWSGVPVCHSLPRSDTPLPLPPHPESVSVGTTNAS